MKVRRFIRRMPQGPEGRFESDAESENTRGGEEGPNRSLRLFRPGDGSGRAQWAMKAGEVPVSMAFSASETLKTP